MNETRTDNMSWEREHGLLAFEGAVEAFGKVSTELDVLLLVLAHRHLGRATST